MSAFQIHFADHDIFTPGDAPGRAGGDEPCGPDGEPPTAQTGAEIIVNTDEFTKRNLTKIGLTESPRRRHPGELSVHPVRA